MNKLAAILALSAALGGCMTVTAHRQAKELIGRPVSEAVARYGPPDQPVTEGARSYSWSGGRVSGVCRLAVKTDASGRITDSSVVGLGFDTCRSLLQRRRRGGALPGTKDRAEAR